MDGIADEMNVTGPEVEAGVEVEVKMTLMTSTRGGDTTIVATTVGDIVMMMVVTVVKMWSRAMTMTREERRSITGTTADIEGAVVQTVAVRVAVVAAGAEVGRQLQLLLRLRLMRNRHQHQQRQLQK
jgi:hypothetical protein